MRRLSQSLLAAAALALPAAATLGFDIDYSADRPAELAACDAERLHGRRADSARCFAGLIAGSDDTRIRAEAAWALADYRAANSFFQAAIDEYPEDPRLRTRWGQLFAVTHNQALAVPLYNEALALDPTYTPAIAAMAEAAADRFEGRAREWVGEALELDPETIAAHLLLARLELEVGNLDSAEASLDRAEQLIEQRALPPLEVYALRAAHDLVRDVFDSPWIARALELNPTYGDAYAIPAYFFVITRRYREAIEFFQSAVEIEPDNYSAHTELGVNLLRENRVDEAFFHLETAQTGFGFDPTTSNTLNLIDNFEFFTVDTYTAETDPAGGGEGVILRLHRDQAEVLTPYVLELINDSIVSFTQRYGFTLQEPVIAELYPNDADFSVRTAGLPGIGLLGVAFGYLVAMNSPPPGLDGEFHWGTTLWHEMAHIFTLKATNHLVPRWFSEGASVHEEWATGPLPGRHIPLHVLGAMAEDRFLPVAELDEGFIRPTYENQVIVSYMQAGLICQYIADNFGQPALERMLEHFRDGDDTPTALEAALGITAEDFDARFAGFIEAEFGALFANLEDFNAAQQNLQQVAAAGDWMATRAAADEAVALNPNYVDGGSPYLYRARAEQESGDETAARDTLQTYWELGGYDPGALMRLARWLRDAGDTDGAIEVFEAILLVAPLDEAVHAELGELLLETRPADALREFTVLGALAPHDQASLNFRLARAHLALEDTDKATEYLLYALEIAPQFREAQKLLLEIVR